MPVVDASILVEYLAGARFEEARSRIASARELWAPHLVDAEVGHVLRREVLARKLSSRAASAAFHDFADLPVRRVAHSGLLERAWALRDRVTFYDALYVALAERLGLPLLTLDGRLAKVRGLRAAVELLA